MRLRTFDDGDDSTLESVSPPISKIKSRQPTFVSRFNTLIISKIAEKCIKHASFIRCPHPERLYFNSKLDSLSPMATT